MASIDNLKTRLLKDDEERAKAIENEARAKAEDILKEARTKAQAILEGEKSRAERDGKEKKERILSRAQLDARNSILSAKQVLIDRVLNSTVEKVNSMNNDEYMNFMEGLILNSVETGDEEIILSEKGKGRIQPSLITTVNSKLNLLGKKGMLKISDETRNIGSGFILKRGKLEVNSSIDFQIRMLRENLESEIANLLFEGR